MTSLSDSAALRARARLARVPALTADALDAAAAAAGSLESLVAEPRERLCRLGLAPRSAAALVQADPARLERDLSLMAEHGIVALASCDPGYPARLRQIPGAPPILHVRGRPEALGGLQLAMVGSRHPTGAGRSTARAFARHFAEVGLGITSGLALGIDAACHEGALDGRGPTIAVCGTGLDRIYPVENADLAERILAAGGALVSELPPEAPPSKRHFPERNRLISGLALGVLVVEAARDSGSLITARYAGEQGRDIFAIPGSIHSPLSRGCHKLIQDGAKLVEEASDVLAELDIPLTFQLVANAAPQNERAAQALARLDKGCEILLDALGFEPVGVDQLVARTGLSSDSIASMLLILELEQRIETRPGGRYSRLPDDPTRLA